MADAPVRHEATDQELRAAYDACLTRARRRGFAPWPATFEAAMADETLSRIVRLTARNGIGRDPEDEPRAAPSPRVIAPAAAPPPPARQHYTFKPPQPGAIDIKRRASGERDDD